MRDFYVFYYIFMRDFYSEYYIFMRDFLYFCLCNVDESHVWFFTKCVKSGGMTIKAET